MGYRAGKLGRDKCPAKRAAKYSWAAAWLIIVCGLLGERRGTYGGGGVGGAGGDSSLGRSIVLGPVLAAFWAEDETRCSEGGGDCDVEDGSAIFFSFPSLVFVPFLFVFAATGKICSGNNLYTGW